MHSVRSSCKICWKDGKIKFFSWKLLFHDKLSYLSWKSFLHWLFYTSSVTRFTLWCHYKFKLPLLKMPTKNDYRFQNHYQLTDWLIAQRYRFCSFFFLHSIHSACDMNSEITIHHRSNRSSVLPRCFSEHNFQAFKMSNYLMTLTVCYLFITINESFFCARASIS